MAWRVLHVTNPTFLHLEQGRIEVKQGEEAVTFAIEDVACIVLDHPQVSVTVPLLAKIAEAKVALLICSSQHLPMGLYLPYVGHTRLLETFQLQQAMSLPKKKALWQQLVKAKLSNQARGVAKLRGPDEAKWLMNLAGRVRSGDVGNVEAVGAQYYWKVIFGKDFLRSEDNTINAALNYGYALIRSLLARSLAASGYYLPLGVHHKNKLNAFNLADDFIEPFRAFVDLFVCNMDLKKDSIFDRERKQEMTHVLQMPCRFADERLILLNACEKIAEVFYKTIRFENELVCPELI